MHFPRSTALTSACLSFAFGFLGASCGTATRPPNAAASEHCPPPPCAAPSASAQRPPAVASSAAARIAAARKVADLRQAAWKRGAIKIEDYLAAEKLALVASRDSGVTGPELVDSVSRYRTTVQQVLELSRKRFPSAIDESDLALVEYALAEADYWVADAKARP